MTENEDEPTPPEDETGPESTEPDSPRERLEEGAERAVDELDRGVVEVLDWLLETETRSRIYVHLRQSPASTSEEIAEGTGLYPSTVREVLAELHDEGIVKREKRSTAGAGNNPYEYRAIAPSELVRDMVGRVQSQLNELVDLDAYLRENEPRTTDDPITISVDEPDADEAEADEGDDPDDRSADGSSS